MTGPVIRDITNLPIRILEPNRGCRDKDLGTAWKMLLTKVDLSLQRRLSLYCIPINSVIGGALTISSS